MRELSLLYIDDSTSRYVFKAINSLLIEYDENIYSPKCIRFDWNNHNPEELKRLFDVIREDNINMFFIDSALYNADSKLEPRFMGIWVAYAIKANIPRSHIAIVSSMHSSETSFAKPEYEFLEKITKDSDRDLVLEEYKKTIKRWIEEDFVFRKSCEDFGESSNMFSSDLINEINLSLVRMESKEELSKTDFERVIMLLEGIINNEE